MAAEAITPGDNPAPPVGNPAEPQTPPAPSQPAPTGNEPDNNSGIAEPAMVPSSRLREETEKRREAEEELENLKNQPPTPAPASNQDDDLDPEVVDMVNKSAKKLGYVTQEELEARETQIQVRQDVRELESTPPVAGIPYDHKAVMDYATANNLPITSRAALQAAYKEMNWDKIVEAERNRAVESYKTSGSASAEKPGSAGPQPPGESEVSGSSPRDRTRSRIGAARQKLQV